MGDGVWARRIWLVARKDMREVFRSRSTYGFTLVMLLASSSYFFSYFSIASTLTREHASAQVIDLASHSFLNSIAFIAPALYGFFACNISSTTVVLDKTKRNLESLMVTPLSIRQVWLGKCLGVTIPSVMIGFGVAIFAYLVIALGEVAPHTHTLIGPSPLAIVSGLVIVPILVFSVVLLVTHLQLVISNPRVGSFVFAAIFIVVLGGLLFAVYYFPVRGISINYYPLVYLGLIVVVGGAAIAASHSLTKERVVLSTKG